MPSSESSLAYRIRQLARGFGAVRVLPSDLQQLIRFEVLRSKLGKVLDEALKSRELPVEILIELESSQMDTSLLNYYTQLCDAVVGYETATTFAEDKLFDEVDDPEFHVNLNPGCISLAWPKVFDSLYCGEMCPGDNASEFAQETRNEELFEVIGFHATACDLLCDWIEKHSSDDDENRVQSGDGLQCDNTIFVWGGETYTSITPTIATLLKVLVRAYRDGRDATGPEFEAALGSKILDGFGRCFDIGKHPNRSKHDVWEVITGQRAKYRLTDPLKAK